MKLFNELLIEGEKRDALKLQQELIELLPDSFDVNVNKTEITSSFISYYLVASKGSRQIDVLWVNSPVNTDDFVFTIKRHYEADGSYGSIKGIKKLAGILLDELDGYAISGDIW